MLQTLQGDVVLYPPMLCYVMIAEDTKGPIWMSECVPSGRNSRRLVPGGGPLSCQIIYPRNNFSLQ